MEEYKRKIYKLWGKKNPEIFPYPDEGFIKEKLDHYRNFFIKNFFPENKNISILDIGCGYGLFLNACKEEGYKNIFGVEIIQECVEFAKKKFNISISNYEIIDYLKSKKNTTFDIITAFDVIEHFKKEEVLNLLELIYKKLKNNGLFIMRVPNAGSLSGLYLLYSDLTHEWSYTSLLAKQLFHLTSFDKIEILPEYNPKNLKSSLLNFFQKIISIISSSLKEKFIFSSNIIVIGYK